MDQKSRIRQRLCCVLLTMIEKGIEMSQINVQKTNEDFAVPWLVYLDMLDMLKTNFLNNDSLLLHRP